MAQREEHHPGPLTLAEPRTWVWREWATEALAPSESVDALAEILRKRFSDQVEITYPSPVTGGQYLFRPRGWVGLWPVGKSGVLSIRPKIPILNVFRMWAWAGGVQWLKGLVDSGTDEDLPDRLYEMLVQRIQCRLHQGLYRAYLPRLERMGHLSGRLDLGLMVRAPWRVDLPCHYQEHTADVKENQILTWTLHLLRRSGVGREATQFQGEKLLRELGRHTTLKQFTAQDCQGFAYHRLNEDYAEIHVLCRFFLEFLSPDHEVGNHPMLAFQVDMAQLFERFVASWLKAHLPCSLRLGVQWAIPYGPGDSFRADMIIQDTATGRCLAVLDTKYKQVEAPSPADVHQARSYAEALNCAQAILVYPSMPLKPMDSVLGRIRTWTLAFPLNGNLEDGGQAFLSALIQGMD